MMFGYYNGVMGSLTTDWVDENIVSLLQGDLGRHPQSGHHRRISAPHFVSHSALPQIEIRQQPLSLGRARPTSSVGDDRVG